MTPPKKKQFGVSLLLVLGLFGVWGAFLFCRDAVLFSVCLGWGSNTSQDRKECLLSKRQVMAILPSQAASQ